MDTALAAAADGTERPLVTLRRTDERVLGSTRFLALRPEHRSVEIGWTWLDPAAWGTGANVEAKLLMLSHAFDAWGCRRVELKTDALNARSRGAMEAMGATFEGIHRKHMLVRDGENRDTAWYAVLEEEWPAVRELLESRLAGHER
jgi:RimJ/RimL family protein N-acetyltransferase